ncbi:MAG: hypothetical protein KAI66_24265, partial [Lentisphaeria bacterium]|nr:hypothetical protein [Lentisphaeria bacterium]
QRDWPPKLARSWTIPAAKVTGADGDWRVTLPFVDGSETGFTIQLGDGGRPASRICLPANISPVPHIAALARQSLSLRKRITAHPESALAKEGEALLQEVEGTVTSFVQSNLARTKPMTQGEWSAMAGGQRRLSGRIAGLVYVLWTTDPLAPFSRTDMPPGLRPDPGVELTACGNDTEVATFVLTNLDDQPLEGRFVLSDLEMAAGKFEGFNTQPNLIRNGDFSKDDNKDNIPDGWKQSSLKAAGFGIERDGAETAFALTGDTGSAAIFRQNVPIKPGTRYTLRAVISTEKLPPTAGNLHIIRDGWTWAKSITARGPTTTKMVYTSSFTAPDAKQFQVVLRLVDANGGTIRYHNLKLVEGAIETATLQNTCIRLHDVAFQPLRLGKTVADPLPRMDGANRFHVPAGESRQFWLS